MSFSKDMLIFKKQSNVDSLKYFAIWHYLLGQIVPSEKSSIYVNVMQIVMHIVIALLTNFLILTFNVDYIQLEML